VLKGILAHLLKHDPLTNPFHCEKILVQSPGMAQWLKMELADELGICANIEFPLPASFIWQTFVDVLDDVPKRSAFNKDAMAWQIITRLPSFLPRDEFSELAKYLSDDEPLKLYQLAYKIADIYDQYLVYRPHWIKAWQQGSTEFSQDQAWQAILWQDLAQTIIDGGQSHYHRANLYENLIAALASMDGAHQSKLPQRIFVFGISALPPKYLEALQAIAQHCDIHFFLNNPCQVYWGDIVDPKWLSRMAGQQRQSLAQTITLAGKGVKSFAQPLLPAEPQSLFSLQGELLVGNPLLASMGKLGRDNLALMLELQAQELEAFAPSQANSQGSVSLLGHLADDMLYLEDRSIIAQSEQDLAQGHQRSPIAMDDHSIVIHRCHSPMREIEVLHDQLLAMFAQDSSLTPKDVVVMMPDVNAYTPFIQAVFSGAKHRIDFSISDQSAQQEKPILLSFISLLDLANLRQSSSELFALLEVPAIMAKFSLTPQSLQSLKLWIDESGIRHGLGLDDAQDNSWQFGLNRMFKGYSQTDQVEFDRGEQPLWQDILSYEESSGLAADQLGQLAHFIELIGHYKAQLTGAKPFSQWQQIIEQLLLDFYYPSLENEQELAVISECLSALEQELSLANFTLPIASEVLFEHLKSNLNSGNSSQRFLAGKLNFCTLMPMRSIPFKVVCVLGMNDGVYPRTIAPLGFDLMANEMQKGDRSRRDDDRYLFLEALLSAQEKFYISYCGRHIKDNSIRCPSVLINELTDYISQGYRLIDDQDLSLAQCQDNILTHLVTEHPLAPFNERYFKPNNDKLFSYQQDWLGAVNRQQQERPFMPAPLPLNLEHQSIELDQLKRFFKQPCQYFLNQRLGVYFGQHDIELTDSEPFNPDGLQSYLIKAQLLDSYLANNNRQTVARLQAQGILPHGHFADLYLDEQSASMAPLAQALKPYLGQSLDDIQVNLSLSPTIDGLTPDIVDQLDAEQAAPFMLQGWLKQHVAPGVLIRYKSGKGNAKFFVDCYLDYLCYCATSSDKAGDFLMFAQDGQWRFRPLPADLAREHLSRLLGYYLQGQTRPLPFFIQSGWQYINPLFDKKNLQLVDDEKSLLKAEKALTTGVEGGFMRIGEKDNPYNSRCFPNILSSDKTPLIEFSRAILLPILVQLEELDND